MVLPLNCCAPRNKGRRGQRYSSEPDGGLANVISDEQCARTRCRVAGAMIRSDLRTGSANRRFQFSRKAVNFSSACTTRRFPSSRCASHNPDRPPVGING